MAKLRLADVRVEECSKPGCGQRLIQRHHKGCERMWIKHFAHRRHTVRFKRFEARYYLFRSLDCVNICEAHHNEIHAIYFSVISGAMKQVDYLPMKEWTWDMAEALMTHLRKVCDEWLGKKSPGKRRKGKMPWQRSTSRK